MLETPSTSRKMKDAQEFMQLPLLLTALYQADILELGLTQCLMDPMAI